jgi:hypothetical protein
MLLCVIKRTVSGYFSFQTLSLYFLFDVTYNSSHLRTSSINFSSIFEDKKTRSTRCKQTLQVQWRGRKTVHTIGMQQAQTGPYLWRHVKHSPSTTQTWRTRSCQCEQLRLITFYWTVTFCGGTDTWRIVSIGLKSCDLETAKRILDKDFGYYINA